MRVLEWAMWSTEMHRPQTCRLAFFTACSPVSPECNDGDANGRCDTCGEAVSPSCSGHLDTDRSGTCDECGEELDTECGLHEDNDKNGYCDFCGRVYDSDEESGDFSDLLPPSDVDLPFDPFV